MAATAPGRAAALAAGWAIVVRLAGFAGALPVGFFLDSAALAAPEVCPAVVAGGGVHYSLAESVLARFASEKNIPIVETMAGKSVLPWSDERLIGPLGVTGSDSVNRVVAQADLIIAVGTRLQDFTTGSWTLFAEKTIIGINTSRFDASKRRSFAVVGDALMTLNEIAPRISVAIQVSAARFVEKSRDERGDVPGWVLVTVMTAGLVVAVWSVADGQLKSVLTSALRSVSQP